MIGIKDNIDKILYTKEEIAKEVKRVGEEITRDYEETVEATGRKPLLIGILKGSFMFMADLVREIDIACKVEFMSAKSYGQGTASSGFVQIVKDVDSTIEGRDVIIVEDILDTGNTLNELCGLLRSRKPASLKVCVFLDKPSGRKVPFKADYTCFEIENEFVVGYGLDYAERYRNLPELRVLKNQQKGDN
jgi:hypoxanthine phosphoribosyltransferase